MASAVQARKTAPARSWQAYLAALPPRQQKALERVRNAILAVAPDAVDGWSYGMPVLKVEGRAIAGLAAFADHLSLFPMSGTALDGVPGVAAFRTSKSTVQFTPQRPLPVALVKAIVRARLAELRDRGR